MVFRPAHRTIFILAVNPFTYFFLELINFLKFNRYLALAHSALSLLDMMEEGDDICMVDK